MISKNPINGSGHITDEINYTFHFIPFVHLYWRIIGFLNQHSNNLSFEVRFVFLKYKLHISCFDNFKIIVFKYKFSFFFNHL